MQELEEYLKKILNCVEYKENKKINKQKNVYTVHKKNVYIKKLTNKLFHRILFKMKKTFLENPLDIVQKSSIFFCSKNMGNS